jgi:hypothetical protein
MQPNTLSQKLKIKIKQENKTMETNIFTQNLTEQLDKLKAAGEHYQADKSDDITGKKIRDLNTRIATLQAELHAAERELAAFKSLGTPERKFENAVYGAESLLRAILDRVADAMLTADVRARYGQDIPLSRVDKGVLRDFRLHKKYSDLKQFMVVSPSAISSENSSELTQKRAKIVWDKITALLEHLERGAVNTEEAE